MRRFSEHWLLKRAGHVSTVISNILKIVEGRKPSSHLRMGLLTIAIRSKRILWTVSRKRAANADCPLECVQADVLFLF